MEFHRTLRPKKKSLCRSCEAGVTSKQRKANQNTRNKSWNATVDRSKSRATLSYTQKFTKLRGRVGPEAFYLGKTSPAVANDVQWTMAVSYMLETESRQWETSHAILIKQRNEGGALCRSCSMHTGTEISTVEGHAALEETGSEEDREKPAAASLTIFDHLYFSSLFTFLLLGLFFT